MNNNSRLHLPGYASYRRGRLWVAPTTGAMFALVVGIAVLLVDRYVITASTPFPKFVDSVETARAILNVTAVSIATLTALVLTIVAIVVQLASDNYSHRALRTLLQDPQTHATLAVFVGTFTYALLALLGMGAIVEGDGSQVAGLTIPVTFFLAVVSLGTFVSYIDHIVHSARGTSIINRIGEETRAEILRLYPHQHDDHDPEGVGEKPSGDPAKVLAAPKSGIVFEIDTDGLAEWAAAHDAQLVMIPAIGDFVPTQAPLIEVYGGDGGEEEVRRFIRLDPERTISDDVGFGFRLLVDIAERAISPSVNDPTTTVQCLDQLHNSLRTLADRRLPTGWHADHDGVNRLYIEPMTWSDYVDLACDEIRIYGEGHLQASRRMRAMLQEVAEIAPEARRKPIERHLRLLDAADRRAFQDEYDQEGAATPDYQGIGGPSLRDE